MGMYYKKLMESAVEPEDVIQTADDVGNDLEAIEKAVEEEHKDGGLDGGCFTACDTGCDDCVDEASIAIFESEFNMSRLMQRIGVVELHEFAEGRDFVLEGANMQAFIAKAREIITSLWKKAVELYQAGMKKLKEIFSVDRKLLAHEKEIIAGCNAGGWELKDTYDLFKLDPKNLKFDILTSGDNELSVKKLVTNTTGDLSAGTMAANEGELSKAACVKRVMGVDVKEPGDADAAIKKELYVRTDVDANTTGICEIVIEVLKTSKDIDALNAAYKNMKSKYSALLQELKDLERHYKTTDSKELGTIVTNTISAVTYEKGLQNKCYSICLSAYRTRRSIARKLAMKWIGIAKKSAPKAKAKNESAGLFDFNLI